MKAIIHHCYGPPGEVLRLEDVAAPPMGGAATSRAYPRPLQAAAALTIPRGTADLPARDGSLQTRPDTQVVAHDGT